MAVGAQRHQACLMIHLSLILGQQLDLVDLDVALCKLDTDDSIAVRGLHLGGHIQ